MPPVRPRTNHKKGNQYKKSAVGTTGMLPITPKVSSNSSNNSSATISQLVQIQASNNNNTQWTTSSKGKVQQQSVSHLELPSSSNVFPAPILPRSTAWADGKRPQFCGVMQIEGGKKKQAAGLPVVGKKSPSQASFTVFFRTVYIS